MDPRIPLTPRPSTSPAGRALVYAMPVQATAQGTYHVVDNDVVYERSDSGQLRRYRPEAIPVDGNSNGYEGHAENENIDDGGVDEDIMFPEEDVRNEDSSISISEALSHQQEDDVGSELGADLFGLEEFEDMWQLQDEVDEEPGEVEILVEFFGTFHSHQDNSHEY